MTTMDNRIFQVSDQAQKMLAQRGWHVTEHTAEFVTDSVAMHNIQGRWIFWADGTWAEIQARLTEWSTALATHPIAE